MRNDFTFPEPFGLPAFLILTPLLSFAVPLLLPLPSEVTPLIIAIIPALLAILLTALTESGKGVVALLRKLLEWRVSFKWYLIALGLALVLRLMMSMLAVLLGWIPTVRLNEWTTPQYVLIGVFTLIGALLEELGWRGYVLPRLLNRQSALASALIIGVPWGIVHLALLLPGMMNEGTSGVATILFLVGLSVILTWFFVQTGYGIVIGMIYHFAQNFFVFLNGGLTSAGSLWLMTAVTIAIAITLTAMDGLNLQRCSTKGGTAANTAKVSSN